MQFRVPSLIESWSNIGGGALPLFNILEDSSQAAPSSAPKLAPSQCTLTFHIYVGSATALPMTRKITLSLTLEKFRLILYTFSVFSSRTSFRRKSWLFSYHWLLHSCPYIVSATMPTGLPKQNNPSSLVSLLLDQDRDKLAASLVDLSFDLPHGGGQISAGSSMMPDG